MPQLRSGKALAAGGAARAKAGAEPPRAEPAWAPGDAWAAGTGAREEPGGNGSGNGSAGGLHGAAWWAAGAEGWADGWAELCAEPGLQEEFLGRPEEFPASLERPEEFPTALGRPEEFSSGLGRPEEFPAGLGMEECDPHGLSALGLQGWPESPGTKDEFSFMDMKLEISSSSDEEGAARRDGGAGGSLSALAVPEAAVPEREWWPCVQPSALLLQGSPTAEPPGTGKSARKGKRSAPADLEPPGRAEAACPVVGSRETAAAPERKKRRSVGRNGKAAVGKGKLRSPRKAGSSSTEEPPAPGGGAGALSGGSFPMPSPSGREQPGTAGKKRKRARIKQPQSTDLQEGAAEEKGKEQDSGSQAVKGLETSLNRSEDSAEKKPYSSGSPEIAPLDGTESKEYLCKGISSAKRSGVQCKKRKKGTDQIKPLQSFAGKVKTTSGNEAEGFGKSPSRCNCSPLAIGKNPVVRLEACAYIDTLVRASLHGSTGSLNISGFLHGKRIPGASQGRRAPCPGGAAEQRAVKSSAKGMHRERSPLQGGCLSREEEKHPHADGIFPCPKGGKSKCARERKWNTGRRPRKKPQAGAEAAVQDDLQDAAGKCSEPEVPAQEPPATSGSSVLFFGLNHKEVTPTASYDRAPKLNVGKNTCKTPNRPVRRKNSSKGLEGCVKETPEVARGEDPKAAAPAGRSAGSGVFAQGGAVAGGHQPARAKKPNRASNKGKRSSGQRTIPMTGKNDWLRKSCARTSAWCYKDHRAKSKQEKLERSALEKASGKSSVEAVGENAVSCSLGLLDLPVSPAEIKHPAHKMMDLNTESLPSLETPESSSTDINGTLRISSNENPELSVNTGSLESPVNTGRSSVASGPGDVQEVKATLNSATKHKDKSKGAARKRNSSTTVRNGAAAGNSSKRNISHKAPAAKQTLSDLKLIKVLNTGNLSNFKIPLRKNKPESRKLEAALSFESPLEVLDNVSVSKRQKRNEETCLVNSEQQPLSAVNVVSAVDSVKKKADDASEDPSKETSTLPEHVPFYPHAAVERPESSGSDSQTRECAPKPALPHEPCSDHSVALELHDDGKSTGNLAQHRSESFPDVFEAYKEDILLIDVIQDDPDLFGISDEEAPSLPDSENCPAKTSCSSTFITEEKPEFKPQDCVVSENKGSVDDFRDSTIRESRPLNDAENSCCLMLKAHEMKTYISSSVSSPLGGVTEDSFEDGQLSELDELLRGSDMDEEFRFADGMAGIKQEKTGEAGKSDCKFKDVFNCELQSGLTLPNLRITVSNEGTVLTPWTNDFRFSGNSSLPPLQNYRDLEPWKMDRNVKSSHSIHQLLEMIELPRKYCRLYFMTLRGCERAKCWFWHVPDQGDEKICMAVLRTYITINELGLLQRATQIFIKYYREVMPGVDFASQVLNDLLISLLKNCLFQEVFQILNVTLLINMLPAVDVLLKIFEYMASLNVKDAVPALISMFCKLVDAGMFLEFEHFNFIIKFLHQLQVSSQELNTILNIKSRFQEKRFRKNWHFDFSLAMTEIQHCKEKCDWTKLGNLYVSLRAGHEHFGDVKKLSLFIAEILSRDSEEERPGVPFCDFADAVIKNSQSNEADRIFIGRAGISVMYSYHKVLQWIKGRKVLDKMHELKIYFTVLKGLIGPEKSASRCQIVNTAAEFFLKTGSLDGATWVLRESEWITNAPVWPCDKIDILNRHNLLRSLVHQCLSKSLYRQAFEVLQNLPGFQNCSDTVDVPWYSRLFNKLINACFESKNLGISSSAIDFMLSKNIPVDFFLLRGLITSLGRSCLWSKARTYYKSALSLGCYPQLQGNTYHKLLPIPSYLSEVEMLLAIEIFLVSNASDVKSPGATSQTLQIILKRCDDPKGQHKDDYQTAVERLILAARLSDPKLFLKHMTMNVNMEEVYSLDLTSALKWLQENMKWAGRVWLFQ